MLSIELHKLVTGEKVIVGPRVDFRLSRNVLQSGSDMVAVYSAGLWRTSTNCFLVLSISPNVHVTYSNETARSEVHGPFDKLFVVDGAVHAGEREGSILARFDETTGHWMCFSGRMQWRDLHFSNLATPQATVVDSRAPTCTLQETSTMSPAETFSIEIESRVIDCRSEHERTMLVEARSICSDGRISERHSVERLREISTACWDYGLQKMGDVIANLANQPRPQQT